MANFTEVYARLTSWLTTEGSNSDLKINMDLDASRQRSHVHVQRAATFASARKKGASVPDHAFDVIGQKRGLIVPCLDVPIGSERTAILKALEEHAVRYSYDWIYFKSPFVSNVVTMSTRYGYYLTRQGGAMPLLLQSKKTDLTEWFPPIYMGGTRAQPPLTEPNASHDIIWLHPSVATRLLFLELMPATKQTMFFRYLSKQFDDISAAAKSVILKMTKEDKMVADNQTLKIAELTADDLVSEFALRLCEFDYIRYSQAPLANKSPMADSVTVMHWQVENYEEDENSKAPLLEIAYSFHLLTSFSRALRVPLFVNVGEPKTRALGDCFRRLMNPESSLSSVAQIMFDVVGVKDYTDFKISPSDTMIVSRKPGTRLQFLVDPFPRLKARFYLDLPETDRNFWTLLYLPAEKCSPLVHEFMDKNDIKARILHYLEPHFKPAREDVSTKLPRGRWNFCQGETSVETYYAMALHVNDGETMANDGWYSNAELSDDVPFYNTMFYLIDKGEQVVLTRKHSGARDAMEVTDSNNSPPDGVHDHGPDDKRKHGYSVASEDGILSAAQVFSDTTGLHASLVLPRFIKTFEPPPQAQPF